MIQGRFRLVGICILRLTTISMASVILLTLLRVAVVTAASLPHQARGGSDIVDLGYAQYQGVTNQTSGYIINGNPWSSKANSVLVLQHIGVSLSLRDIGAETYVGIRSQSIQCADLSSGLGDILHAAS